MSIEPNDQDNLDIPGKRQTRSASVAERNMALSRRNQFERNIKRLIAECTDDLIKTMLQSSVDDNIIKIQRNFDKFEIEHLLLIAEAKTPQETQDHDDKYAEVDEQCSTLRQKLMQRALDLKKIADDARGPTPANIAAPQTVEVNLKSANLLSNIDDTWGTFHGEWDKWPDFREKFKANVHENDVLTPVQKCQLLIKACKGAAFASIGGKDLAATEANYLRSWQHLHEVYTDDYLAIQQTLKKLIAFKPIQEATYQQLRRMLDMIHEVEGWLSNFFEIKHWEPIIMFICLFRVDAATYEKWETERQNLSPRNKATEDQNDVNMADVGDDQAQVQADEEPKGPAIPSLKQFKKFLECRARILLHQQGQGEPSSNQQSRSRDSSLNRQRPTSNTGAIPKVRPKTEQEGSKRSYKKLPLCRLCNEDHGLFKCPKFLNMSFDERIDMVKTNKLCPVCFHSHAEGECYVDQRPCNRCNGRKYHNTIVCPTREAEKRTTFMSVVGNSPEPLTFRDRSNKRRDERRD